VCGEVDVAIGPAEAKDGEDLSWAVLVPLGETSISDVP
jgi:hypothetical protein